MIEFHVNTYEGFVHTDCLLLFYYRQVAFICFGIESNDLQDEIRYKLRCWNALLCIIIYDYTKISRIWNKTSLRKLFQGTLTMIEPSQNVSFPKNQIEQIQNYGYQAMNERWTGALENYFLIIIKIHGNYSSRLIHHISLI